MSVTVPTRFPFLKLSVIRNIKDSNVEDIIDRELNRVGQQFGDYERVERC